MSYNNLRKGRYSEHNQLYFVTMVIHNRKQIFSELLLARKAAQQLRAIHDNQQVTSFAWVIMPDHIHWLFQLNEKQVLSNIIALFKGRTARIINKEINKKGKFWQPAYFEHAVRKDEDIKQIARYIVANPLRAGLVDKIEDYPHWDAIWL